MGKALGFAGFVAAVIIGILVYTNIMKEDFGETQPPDTSRQALQENAATASAKDESASPTDQAETERLARMRDAEQAAEVKRLQEEVRKTAAEKKIFLTEVVAFEVDSAGLSPEAAV